MNSLKFSGHDTFHCRESWLLKGYQQVYNQGYRVGINSESSLVELGVGKNMVRAIGHWMRSFGLLDLNNFLTDFANELFSKNGFDKYLEDTGTLWLLQYKICSTNYASIYKLLFLDYFLDKASQEFSEKLLLSFLKRTISENKVRMINDNTLLSDFKVLIKTYLVPKRNNLTMEDDFNAPMQSLNLIVDSGRKKENGDKIYLLNKKNIQKDLSIEIFGYCTLDQFSDASLVNYEDLKNTLGAYLCLTNDGLFDMIQSLCEKYKEFSFKGDASVEQLQFRIAERKEFMDKLLKVHYCEKQ